MSPLWPGLIKRNNFIQIWKFLPIFFFIIHTCSLYFALYLKFYDIDTSCDTPKAKTFMHMYIIIQPWINVKKIINNSDCFFYNCMKHSNFCWNLLYYMYPTIYNCKSLLIIFVMFFFLDLYGRAYWSQLIPWMR